MTRRYLLHIDFLLLLLVGGAIGWTGGPVWAALLAAWVWTRPSRFEIASIVRDETRAAFDEDLEGS